MVAMMQTTNARCTHDLGGSGLTSFDRPFLRRLLLQAIMNAIFVIIVEVISNEPTQMGFVQHDHVVQEFSTTASHPALCHTILPRAAISRANQLAAEAVQLRGDFSPELGVAVEDQVGRVEDGR